MRILGIDPGSTRIGYGLIAHGRELQFLDCGTIEVAARDQREKLGELARRFAALLRAARPDAAGIETLFFAKNRKTALAVAEARGVLLLALARERIPTHECSPREVKVAVCGYGNADKVAVARMVCRTLRLPRLNERDDATDALAIAIAAASRVRFETMLKG